MCLILDLLCHTHAQVRIVVFVIVVAMSVEKVIRLKEVQEHKVAKGKDKAAVWIAIHDAVYDVTKFLDEVKTRS